MKQFFHLPSSFFLLVIIFLPSFFSFAQSPIDNLVNERLASIPLPDPVTYYGQNEAFAAEITAAYCNAAAVDELYLGEQGWIFTQLDEIDFGRERVSRKALSYADIVFYLREYRKALETVGFSDSVMMVVPSKALLGERYLTTAQHNILEKQNTRQNYYIMRQAYLDAGFKHVPDLLRIGIELSAEGIYAHFPIDHHFTTHSAQRWAAEASKAILSTSAYEGLAKTPVTLALQDRRFEVVGWAHMRQVWNRCDIDYPKVYMPYYEQVYTDTAPSLLDDVQNDIVVVGNSNIGFEFNRPGSAGEDVTPGTGTSDFLASLTQLQVLKYGVFSQANAAIEQYLRSDFKTEPPPTYLVHFLEAHLYPYPAYNYRSLPALTYGKCETPVYETTAERKGRINIDLSAAQLNGNSANYYFWLELDAPAELQSSWVMRETYSSGLDETLLFDTDDRFLEFPTSFALQLRPEQGQLTALQITPESGWAGSNITLSLCDIRQVQESYEALGR